MNERITIGEGGRLVIPVKYRKAMQIKPGDELIVKLEDGELRLFQQKQALENLRKAFRKNRDKNIKNYTDEFLEFRKRDSGI
jgi:AbrB family looped-hinge helix DNA binding protein